MPLVISISDIGCQTGKIILLLMDRQVKNFKILTFFFKTQFFLFAPPRPVNSNVSVLN